MDGQGSVWQVRMGTEKLKGCGDGEDVGRARSGSEGKEEGMTSDNASSCNANLKSGSAGGL